MVQSTCHSNLFRQIIVIYTHLNPINLGNRAINIFVSSFTFTIRYYSLLFATIRYYSLYSVTIRSLFATIRTIRPLFVTIRLYSRLFATIRDYSGLFVTIRHYSRLFALFGHYSGFIIGECPFPMSTLNLILMKPMIVWNWHQSVIIDVDYSTIFIFSPVLGDCTCCWEYLLICFFGVHG